MENRTYVDATEGRRASGKPRAERILRIMDAVTDGHRPATITQLVDLTGLPMSSVHRLCWQLVDLGMLEHTDHGFLVGTRMIAMANAHPSMTYLRGLSMPHLVDLQNRTRAAAALVIRAGESALILDGVYPKAFKRTAAIGGRLPLHCTAVGKVLLAETADDERDQVLGRIKLSAMTPRSIVHPERLRAHLEMVRDRGFAVSQEEYQRGIISIAAAFRTGDGISGAIGTVGFSTDRSVMNSAALVRRAATAITSSCGA